MIFKSSSPAIDIPDTSWSEYFLERIEVYENEIALIDGENGKSTSFAELKKNIHSIARSLQQKGYKKGDVFAIYAPNLPEYVFAFQAVLLIGGVVTTVNPLYTSSELEHQLNHSQTGCLFTTSLKNLLNYFIKILLINQRILLK